MKRSPDARKMTQKQLIYLNRMHRRLKVYVTHLDQYAAQGRVSEHVPQSDDVLLYTMASADIGAAVDSIATVMGNHGVKPVA